MAGLEMKIILHLDDSEGSSKLRSAFEKLGKKFSVVYEVSDRKHMLPAIETPLAIIRGYDNIVTYFGKSWGLK